MIIEKLVDDVDPPSRGDVLPPAVEPEAVVEVVLTVAEQRAMVEAEAGGPCFRIWLTQSEFARSDFCDWTCYTLSDGRVAIWRRESDMETLQAQNVLVYRAIMSRRIDDNVI